MYHSLLQTPNKASHTTKIADSGLNDIKPFFSKEDAKQARVFVPGKPFHAGLIFVSKGAGKILDQVGKAS
jgi:hypothetical protein